ncbi:hypothetical protein S245_001431, partial [Arachis hypogaea]
DVSLHMEDHDLLKKYAHYMSPTRDLQFIYVPIKENDHWYLMVMSIPDKILYHLDSHCKVEDGEPRKHHIRNI